MKEQIKEFKAIKLADVKSMQKANTAVSTLEIPANAMQKAFTDYFSYFNIEDLRSLIESDNKPKWIATKWVELNGIQTNQLSVDKLLELGLLQVPDYQALIDRIKVYQNQFDERSCGNWVKDISEIFDPKANKFVDQTGRMDDSEIVCDRIEDMYTFETVNEAENEYLNTVFELKRVYEKLLNELKVINHYAVPANFFTVTKLENGMVFLDPHHQLLKEYRKRGH